MGDDYTDVLIILITKGYVDFTQVKQFMQLQLFNKKLYLTLYPKVDSFYDAYVRRQQLETITKLNNLAAIIDNFKYNNTILKSRMYEYIMLLYANWSVLSMNESLRSKVRIPTISYFREFLDEHAISISSILPQYKMHYTHYHHQSKTSSGFITLH